jgi:hypothetical protein
VDVSCSVCNYHDEIVATGKQPLFLLFVGLIVGFLFIRTSTRLIRARVRWWPGNVSAGGVHLHHELFGVTFMLVAGTLGFAPDFDGIWNDVAAAVFGVGAGLVLDEYALLLHLEDVYWTNEGRTSIDAVVAAVMLTGMLLVGAAPFGLTDASSAETGARWSVFAVVGVNLAFTMLTALKGKHWLALLSVFVPVVGVVAGLRLAVPHSPWARWRYRDGSDTLDVATARADRWMRRKNRLLNMIGGAPSQPDPAA